MILQEFYKINYRTLQKLAKEFKIRANQKREVILSALVAIPEAVERLKLTLAEGDSMGLCKPEETNNLQMPQELNIILEKMAQSKRDKLWEATDFIIDELCQPVGMPHLPHKELPANDSYEDTFDWVVTQKCLIESCFNNHPHNEGYSNNIKQNIPPKSQDMIPHPYPRGPRQARGLPKSAPQPLNAIATEFEHTTQQVFVSHGRTKKQMQPHCSNYQNGGMVRQAASHGTISLNFQMEKNLSLVNNWPNYMDTSYTSYDPTWGDNSFSYQAFDNISNPQPYCDFVPPINYNPRIGIPTEKQNEMAPNMPSSSVLQYY